MGLMVRNHPTGLAAAGTSIAIIVASKLGVDLSATEAGLIIGSVATLVSKLTPRMIYLFDAAAIDALGLPSEDPRG